MKYLRLYTGPDGDSHFDDAEMEVHPVSGRSSHGRSWPSGEAIFLSSEEDSGPALNEWHNAPARQFVITLSGTTEIEASDGEVRRFGPGEVLLVEDTSGKGHRTRYKGARTALHVPIREG
jgi:hypothetical protein